LIWFHSIFGVLKNWRIINLKKSRLVGGNRILNPVLGERYKMAPKISNFPLRTRITASIFHYSIQREP